MIGRFMPTKSNLYCLQRSSSSSLSLSIYTSKTIPKGVYKKFTNLVKREKREGITNLRNYQTVLLETVNCINSLHSKQKASIL